MPCPVNSSIPPSAEPEKHITQDNDLIAEVLFGIQSRYSEDRIRAKFQEYAQGLVDIAFDDAEYVDDLTKKKVVTNNQQRVDFIKSTICFKNYKNVRRPAIFTFFLSFEGSISSLFAVIIGPGVVQDLEGHPGH